MMNRRIRSMIDSIFAQMKMTAENLALRDELMANAQARYEDAVSHGMTEEEAFAEVAASLGDVQSLLREMNGEVEEEETAAAFDAPDAAQEVEQTEEPQTQTHDDAQFDLGDTLNKAFSALSDLGKSIMPQAKKIVREVDDVTGGVIVDIGRAVNRSVRDAQKAASDTIDKLGNKSGEIVFDFGPKNNETEKTEAKDKNAESEEGMTEEKTAESGDAQTEEEGETLCIEEHVQPLYGADDELNEDAFLKAVDEMTREAERITDDEQKIAEEAREAAEETKKTTEKAGGVTARGEMTFPVAGLRKVEIHLDADDVSVEPGANDEIAVRWEIDGSSVEPEITMVDHKLTIGRKNPDVFKTFFSVFKKDGGKIWVGVPRGYAADYEITTTSGDILLRDVDVDDVKANTTSGCMRIEPEAAIRAKTINATTVSGPITVSACAEDVLTQTVSGNSFISCDADAVEASAVSGKVHLEGACDEWKISSVSGQVKLLCTVVPVRKIDVDTVSANVRVALPGEVRGFVAELSGMSGKIVNEFGPNRYGTCALPIHMDTMSGNLMITRL